MKHAEDSFPSASAVDIIAGLASIGVATTDRQAQLIARHAKLVAAANRSMNLTRITEAADVLTLHIMDSALALDALEACPSGPIIDLGSGAGYPGVVLAVLSGRKLVLIESVKKKAAFLREACSDLGIEADVYALRAEEVAATFPEAAPVVVARAVSSLPALVELSAPLLNMGGRLIALKAQVESIELQDGRRAGKLCGLREIGIEKKVLRDQFTRSIIVYERVSASKIVLPRRPGMAQRAPLGR